jgi:ribosomal protein S24E
MIFDMADIQVIDVIHPGRANVSKAELQEKLGEVRDSY